MAWLMVQTGSMDFTNYLSWLLTIVMSSDVADNYNGQQGDIVGCTEGYGYGISGVYGDAVDIYVALCNSA